MQIRIYLDPPPPSQLSISLSPEASGGWGGCGWLLFTDQVLPNPVASVSNPSISGPRREQEEERGWYYGDLALWAWWLAIQCFLSLSRGTSVSFLEIPSLELCHGDSWGKGILVLRIPFQLVLKLSLLPVHWPIEHSGALLTCLSLLLSPNSLSVLNHRLSSQSSVPQTPGGTCQII